MSNDTAEIVILGAAGLLAWSLLRKRPTGYTAGTRLPVNAAAASQRTAAAVIGPSVAAGLVSLFGRSSKPGTFAPAAAATPPMDWGVGAGWGDDSTAGAVIEPFDNASADGVWD